MKNNDFFANFRSFILFFLFIFIINRSLQDIIDYFAIREI